MRDIFRLGDRRTSKFKLGTGMDYDDHHHRHAWWCQRPNLMSSLWRSCRQADACLPINSTTKSHRNTKFGRKVVRASSTYGWYSHSALVPVKVTNLPSRIDCYIVLIRHHDRQSADMYTLIEKAAAVIRRFNCGRYVDWQNFFCQTDFSPLYRISVRPGVKV